MHALPLLLVGLVAVAGAAQLVPKAAGASPTSSCTFCGPPPCTPTPLAIGNPGFQTGHLAPWKTVYEGQNISTFSVVSTGPQAYALRIDSYVTHYEIPQPLLQQTNLVLCPTNQYQISFDYQVLKPFSGASVNGDVFVRGANDMSGEFGLGGAAGVVNVTTHGWQRAMGFADVVAAETATVAVNVIIYGEAPHNEAGPIVLVDNVTVVPYQSLVDPSCPHPPNPLANPRFQTGQLAPWEIVYISDPANNISLVAGSDGDAQPYALRFQYTGNGSDVEMAFSHPVDRVCLGYVYVFELDYNVIEPMPPPFLPADEEQYSYFLDMGGCTSVNATMQESSPFGLLPFNVAGPATVKAMCRMRHNTGALFKMYFLTTYPGNDAIVDVLGLTVRLATAADFDEPA